MIDQKFEAGVFAKNNATKVEELTRAVNLAGKKLLEAHGDILQKNVSDLLNEKISSGKWDDFFAILRSQASEFGRAGLSNEYWNVIDAYGALGDATGSYWPYMSQATREARLQHAEGHVNELLEGSIAC